MKKHWKKLLAVSLAAVVLLAGGLAAWHFWPGGAGDPVPAPDPAASLEFPLPDPIEIAPPEPNPPPVQNYGPDPADFRLDEATGMEYVKGIAVLMFERGASGAQMQAALAASGGEIVGRADMVGKWELRVPAEDYPSLLALCARLEAMPGVAAAMPDHVTRVELQVPDTGDGWTGGGYTNAANNSLWAEIDRLPEAWAAFHGLSDVTARLGMVDSGVNASHVELTGIVNVLNSVHGFNSTYTYTSEPDAHGTAVAGVMAARAGNAAGGAGIAWKAEISAIDCISAGNTESVYYDSILAVAREGAQAINFSIGMIKSNGTGTSIPDAHGKAAAANLWQMIAWGYKNFVVVQSAGNSSVDSKINGYFASVTAANAALAADRTEMVLNRILVAGALEKYGSTGYQLTSFSAYGGGQQINAPGTNIFAPTAGGTATYQITQGTSFAAPQITATAGWMLALNPDLDAGQVGALLKREVVSPPVVRPNELYGGGVPKYRMLDCMRALESVEIPRLASLQPATVTVQPKGRYIILSEKTTAEDLAAALQPLNAALSYAKLQSDPTRPAATGEQVKAVGVTGLETTYTLVLRGDLNGDGQVNALDAQCLLGKTASPSTWQPNYPQAVYDLALNGMTAQQLFAEGMK